MQNPYCNTTIQNNASINELNIDLKFKSKLTKCVTNTPDVFYEKFKFESKYDRNGSKLFLKKMDACLEPLNLIDEVIEKPNRYTVVTWDSDLKNKFKSVEILPFCYNNEDSSDSNDSSNSPVEQESPKKYTEEEKKVKNEGGGTSIIVADSNKTIVRLLKHLS